MSSPRVKTGVWGVGRGVWVAGALYPVSHADWLNTRPSLNLDLFHLVGLVRKHSLGSLIAMDDKCEFNKWQRRLKHSCSGCGHLVHAVRHPLR